MLGVAYSSTQTRSDVSSATAALTNALLTLRLTDVDDYCRQSLPHLGRIFGLKMFLRFLCYISTQYSIKNWDNFYPISKCYTRPLWGVIQTPHPWARRLRYSRDGHPSKYLPPWALPRSQGRQWCRGLLSCMQPLDYESVTLTTRPRSLD
jgi:hypothetical protein